MQKGIRRDTLQRILRLSEPTGYRRTKRWSSKLEPFLPLIHQLQGGDRKVRLKLRHKSQRIFDRLRGKHGETGVLTIAEQALRACREHHRGVFLRLSHPPGKAQMDSESADVLLNGKTVRLALLVMPALCR